MLSGKSCDERKLMLLHASHLVARHSPPLARGISTLYSELTERGFISQATRQVFVRFHHLLAQPASRPQQLSHALETASQTVYSGIDPTGSALHIGHLFPMMCLLHFELRNHHTIPLVRSSDIPQSHHRNKKSDRWRNRARWRSFWPLDRTLSGRCEAGPR